MNAPGDDSGSLDHLREIVLPAPVPLLPPAPGWYFLGALLLAGGVLVAWRLARRWRRDRYRRVALAELERLAATSRSNDHANGAVAAARALPGLLKRAALAGFPREDVASLSGEAWLEFLDATASTSDFTRGAGRVLESLAYRARASEELEPGHLRELFELARRWIREHRARAAANASGELP